MPVPYMSSKSKIASQIYNAIANREKVGTIYDLFCGGFAISEQFIKNGWHVVANDKNKYVVALIKYALDGGFNDNEYYSEWVSRKQFDAVIANPDDYPDWYVGYIQCIWSFGNNGRYLFGKEIEEAKQLANDLVVGGKTTPSSPIPMALQKKIAKLDDWHIRRIAGRTAKKLNLRLKQLQQLWHSEYLGRLKRLRQVEHLEYFERLERLRQLEPELHSGSYDELEIPAGAVIYCDPPHQNTAEYVENGFDHAQFWQWCREKSKTNPVYISEYNSPDDFMAILDIPKNTTLQGGNGKVTHERLYIYRGSPVL